MKFRKKPVVIDATRFNPPYEIPTDVVMANYCIGRIGKKDVYEPRYFIHTLEGDMEVKKGDWIITGVEGERYPCKASIFEATYEKVKA